MTTTLSPSPSKTELKQRTQTVPMDAEFKLKFLHQLETQVVICEAAVKLLENLPDIEFQEFQRLMRNYIYDNELEDKAPFKAVFNELYHVYKRFNNDLPIDKGDRNSLYMTFYTYDFQSESFHYDKDTQKLKIDTPTLTMEIFLVSPLPDEALVETFTENETKKTKYINLGYHKDTQVVTLDLFY